MCETDRNVDIKIRVARKKAQREIIKLQEEIRMIRVVLARFMEQKEAMNENIRKHCEEQLAILKAALEAAKLVA